MEPITVIIETPKGKKYKCDIEQGYVKLKKLLPAGLIFPYDFGFIPGTIGGDGDPLDVMVISEIETFSGCAIDCRIIGGLKAVQTERDGKKIRNDRLFAIPEISEQYVSINELKDLPQQVIHEIEQFFINYNEQAGKVFEPLNHFSAKKALKLIENSKRNGEPSKRIELFIPVYNKKGKPFPKKYYTNLHQKLTDKFGGLTMYSRVPVIGFWKENTANTVKENIIVYEVLATEIDDKFWSKLKKWILKTFAQEEIIIHISSVSSI
ncbi:inorganic diphosphatase [Pedobacter boryungensis]|uniref:inorganic diphosphatase n=1 Tax=Pedobacter boryungensis TaxID=869962 RepID=A0ABX2DCB3_9SPHI|nr:inorganic diphosphatase [Pedobacter boryungensis]NQX30641.1 inorganic diphosphatase [Pedobacter boryungensis]